MIPLLLLWAQSLDPDTYSRGMQAANTGQWEEARREFLSGLQQFPLDKRFPIELAGIAYRDRDYRRARRYLSSALRLDRSDTYANDFLGTLYFLDSNYPAALKYWNRAGKPRIASVETVPPPPVRPVLLDRALAFAPGEILQQREYESTVAWIRSLESFGRFRIELAARPQEQFDAVLRWTPTSRWMEAAMGLRSVLLETVEYERSNIAGRAITSDTVYRWDAQKRRIFSEVSAPLHNDPRTRYRIYGDARSETWNIGAPADFRLQKAEAGAALRFLPSGRLSWELGARFADRKYAGDIPFASGFTAVSRAAAEYRLVNLPERGLSLDARAGLELGRFFTGSGHVYSRAQMALESRWKPTNHPKYEFAAVLGGGRILGTAPYDELFTPGRESDDRITLRGHSGVREGKKGVAPVAGQYAMANFDAFREVWNMPLAAVDVGPLLDIVRMGHQISGNSAGKLLVDAGIQARLRLTNGLSVAFSYARPVHGGSGGLFDSSLR